MRINKHHGKPFILEEHILPTLKQLFEEDDNAEERDKYIDILIDEFGKHQVRQWMDLIDNEYTID